MDATCTEDKSRFRAWSQSRGAHLVGKALTGAREAALRSCASPRVLPGGGRLVAKSVAVDLPAHRGISVDAALRDAGISENPRAASPPLIAGRDGASAMAARGVVLIRPSDRPTHGAGRLTHAKAERGRGGLASPSLRCGRDEGQCHRGDACEPRDSYEAHRRRPKLPRRARAASSPQDRSITCGERPLHDGCLPVPARVHSQTARFLTSVRSSRKMATLLRCRRRFRHPLPQFGRRCPSGRRPTVQVVA